MIAATVTAQGVAQSAAAEDSAAASPSSYLQSHKIKAQDRLGPGSLTEPR